MTKEEFIHRFVQNQEAIECTNPAERAELAMLMTSPETGDFHLYSGTSIVSPYNTEFMLIVATDSDRWKICGARQNFDADKPRISYEDALSVYTGINYATPSDEEFNAAFDSLLL